MFTPLPTESMSVEQLFGGNNHFSVPNYQRPYAWSVDEAARLLDDIVLAAGIEEGQPIESDYFLGAVLLLDAGASKQSHEYEIIDGQQRLVTLTILAAVLRKIVSSLPQARRLGELIDQAGTGDNEEDAFRLSLSGADRSVLERFVQEADGVAKTDEDAERLTPGQSAILAARDRFAKDLEQFDQEQLQALADYICEGCHFVVIVSTEIDRAHRIFTILNDRGRPLDRKDILKAEILRAVEPDQKESTLAIWQQAELQLGADMENFLSHLSSVHGHDRPQVIAGVRRVVRGYGSPAEFMREAFKPLAEAFSTILAARDETAEIPLDLRRPLVRLLRLNGREWVPAAIQILRRPEMATELKGEYLTSVERAAYLMRLVCLGAGKRQPRFAKICALLGEPEMPKPDALFNPTKEELRTIAYNLRDLHSRNVQVCKALLLRLNDELQPEALFAKPSSFTVEHVLPQRPKASSLWRDWFPDGEQRMALTASLGNLVLVSPSYNDRVRNAEFQRKKEVYVKAAADQTVTALTHEVLSGQTWQSAQILEREKRLVSAINEIWQLEIEPPN